MSLISITSETGDAENLFKQPEYPVLPVGKHLFAVKNKIEIVDSESGASDLIKAEFVCQDEDENKGMVVFENFVFLKNEDVDGNPILLTDGQKKSLEINQARFAQFVVACGVATAEEIKTGGKFDLDDLEGKVFNASSAVRMEDKYPQELDEGNKPIKARKASIKQFLYEPKKSE